MAKIPGETAQSLRQVGRVLRAVRERLDLTQSEVAQRISAELRQAVDAARVSDVERGTTDAQFSTLDRHARALGFAGGILEAIATEGDVDVPELLRAWRALPDQAARDVALEVVVRRAFPARGPAPQPQVLTDQDARLLRAYHALPTDAQRVLLGMIETHPRRDVTGKADDGPQAHPARRRARR